jgi:hypothetical protein
MVSLSVLVINACGCYKNNNNMTNTQKNAQLLLPVIEYYKKYTEALKCYNFSVEGKNETTTWSYINSDVIDAWSKTDLTILKLAAQGVEVCLPNESKNAMDNLKFNSQPSVYKLVSPVIEVDGEKYILDVECAKINCCLKKVNIS